MAKKNENTQTDGDKADAGIFEHRNADGTVETTPVPSGEAVDNSYEAVQARGYFGVTPDAPDATLQAVVKDDPYAVSES